MPCRWQYSTTKRLFLAQFPAMADYVTSANRRLHSLRSTGMMASARQLERFS
jgi:hypothetical protein